jgi:hypothetical protein
MSRFTFSAEGATETVQTALAGDPGLLEEFVLFAILLFVFAQMMKVVEFCIFKLKI